MRYSGANSAVPTGLAPELSLSKRIWIVNPAAGCLRSHSTSHCRAQRYVDEGRAKWVSARAVEFLDCHQHRAVLRSVDETALHYTRCVQQGALPSDVLAHLRGIPVYPHPELLLIQRGRA